jgi:plasmid stabilization system protein ParE
MLQYSIRLLKIAEEDFTEIINYLSGVSPKAANEIADKIESNLSLLSANPFMGRIPKDEDIKNLNYRYIVVDNYIIFYTVKGKTVYIHRIFHGARDYKSLL